MNKTVLITGASSGIGKVLLKQLIELNYDVIGLSRRPAKDLNYTHFSCDLSDPKAIEKTALDIQHSLTKLDAMIHVAGYGIADALEYTTYQDAERIHRVNVLGPFYLNRLLLPMLRKGIKPKIIHVGSVAGTLTIPFQAFYSMSKASLFSYSEALRMELKPFKISVSIILPGDIKTPFTENRKKTYKTNDPLYKNRIERAITKMAQDEQNGMAPERVTNTILKMLNKRRLPIFKTIGVQYKLIMFLAKFLPHRLRLYFLYKLYGK